MRKYGLIGFPLGHSFSRTYFNDKFKDEGLSDCQYENYELKNIEELKELVTNDPELVGLNITIPYKQKVLSVLDEIEEEAQEIGAVNTIKINRLGSGPVLKGFNTDVFGFEKPLNSVLSNNNYKALILGTGGASKAVAWVLQKRGIMFSFVSRTTGEGIGFTYEQLKKSDIEEHKIIINTSPVGTFPNIAEAPEIDYSGITSNHILYDLVYNPEETLFLKKGAQKKAITINGLPMLYFQANKAWEIWNS